MNIIPDNYSYVAHSWQIFYNTFRRHVKLRQAQTRYVNVFWQYGVVQPNKRLIISPSVRPCVICLSVRSLGRRTIPAKHSPAVADDPTRRSQLSRVPYVSVDLSVEGRPDSPVLPAYTQTFLKTGQIEVQTGTLKKEINAVRVLMLQSLLSAARHLRCLCGHDIIGQKMINKNITTMFSFSHYNRSDDQQALGVLTDKKKTHFVKY